MVQNNGVTFSKDPLGKRLLKGMFRQRPLLPCYTVTYNMNIDTMKTATLLCLLMVQRHQSLHELNIKYLHTEETQCVIYIPAILKTTTMTFHAKSLILQREHLCGGNHKQIL